MVLGLLACVGCSRQKVEDFKPSTDRARKSLEAALNHWLSGQPPDKVPGTSPAIQVIDSKWKSGQKLMSYEILGEEPGSDPVFFKVRLTLAKGGVQEVRYAVVGIDPLLIAREEDYQGLSGMGKK
jgi:hypothetical protein